MSKQIYVLISGKRLNGKDTLAEALTNAMRWSTATPEDPAIHHLADAIRQELMDTYPDEIPSIKSIQDNSSPIKKKWRPAMISLGQQRRAEDVDYWCIKLQDVAEAGGADIIIVPDCRFLNEIEYFKKLDDILVYSIRIETVLQERIRRGYTFTPGVDDDVSELSLDLGYKDMPWDALIVDTGFGVQLYKEPHKKDITATARYNKSELFKRTLEDVLPEVETRRAANGQDNNS